MTGEQFEIMFKEANEDSKKTDIEVKEKAKRIFNSIDLDGGGTLTITELHQALANFAPPTSFSALRRHVLLQYGSYDNFFTHMASKELNTEDGEDVVQIFTAENDLNIADGTEFAEQFGLMAPESAKKSAKDVTPEGYTVE